jgi:YVTN family beta-propeller protein
MKWWKLAAILLLAAWAAGCGGGGNDNQTGISVSLSPTSAGVVLNGTTLFYAVVTGVKSATIATTNGAVRASNVVTITTTAAHGFASGETITISGVLDTSFNGTFTITAVPSSTTLTYAQTGTDATAGSGTVANNAVKWFVNDVEGGNATVGTITTGGLYTAPATLPPPLTATIASNGVKLASNVVTITTTADHNFLVGQNVLISGVSDTIFNGTFTIVSVPTSTTFTYYQTGSDATSTGGTASSSAVKVKAVSTADSSASATAVVSIDSGVTVRVTPSLATVGTLEQFYFSATVTGSSNTAVNWFVNDVAGGNSSVGTISSSGLYTAPASPPTYTTTTIAANGAVRASNAVTITSNGAVRASDVVTITTTTAHGFLTGQRIVIAGVSDSSFNGSFTIASVPTSTTFTYSQTGTNATSGGGTAALATPAVTITTTTAHGFLTGQRIVIAGVSDSSFNGSFTVASVPTSTTFTYSQTGPDATSGGGTAALVTGGVTIKAVSVADPLRLATAVLTLQTPTDPTLTEIHPNTVAQGAALLDLYLTGTDFLSTSSVRVAGSVVPSTMVSAVLLRARVPTSLLEVVGTYPVDVQRQGGATTPALNLTVVPVRPALVGTSPDSAPQGGGAVSVNFNGGYFTSSVTAEVNGQVRAATLLSSRQMNVAVSAADLSTAGLFPILVRNPAAPQPIAATNLAIQPTGSPSTLATVAVGSQPSAVAVNTGTGVAVVANRGSNNISLIDLATNTVINTIAVGTSPTGVAVDNVRNLAVVANNGNDTISVVNLATGTVVATITSPTPSGSTTPLKPFAVGVNPVTGLALVANQSTNQATIIDLSDNSVRGTVEISTGANPSVAIEPRLNWAVVTPGGAGTLSIVDLGRRSVVVTATVGATMRGVAVSPETEKALMVDPASTAVSIMSVLDQTISQLSLDLGQVAAAINPFTDVGVTVDPNLDRASIIDLRVPSRLATIPVGTDPRAVAIDPGTNVAVVANEGSNNVSILSLGPIRPLHVLQIGPAATLTSSSDLTVSVIGSGFTAASQVRLDETPVATTFVSTRRLTATVPAALLAAPRRFALDVVDAAGPSNVMDFVVVQVVAVGTAPRAVAYDVERNVTLVANAGSNNVSVVDNTTGTVSTTISVGTNPQGVAVMPRIGRAVVTNRGSNDASVIDLAGSTVVDTALVGSEPIGVAINQDTGFAAVANSASNNFSSFSVISPGEVSTASSDTRPVAVAVDPIRNYAAVTHTSSNTVVVYNLADNAMVTRITGFQIPTGVTFDPISEHFIAVSSLSNNLGVINPETSQATPVRVGINPTGVAYNFNSGTLITVNTASRTATIMDFLDRRVRAMLDLDVGVTIPLETCRVNPADSNSVTQLCSFAVDVDVLRNLALVVDEGHNRLLLIPLPR